MTIHLGHCMGENRGETSTSLKSTHLSSKNLSVVSTFPELLQSPLRKMETGARQWELLPGVIYPHREAPAVRPR